MSEVQPEYSPTIGTISFLNNIPDRNKYLQERKIRRETISRRMAEISVQLYREQQKLKREKWWSEFKP